MKPQQLPEPSTWDWTVMDDAATAAYWMWRMRYDNAEKTIKTDPTYVAYHAHLTHMDETRAWWISRYYNNRTRPLHPVVDKFRKQWRPLDWQQLLFEHPYVSEKDPSKIAYTPNERYGQDDRQLITSIGKYLNKHWPHVPDHLRRDAVAAYSFDEMTLVHTMPEIIQGIEMGPRSCMQSGYGSIPFNSSHHRQMCEWFKDPQQTPPPWHRHPYVVYDPAFGWHMAVRKKDGEFLGRALCLSFEGTNVFVRTYSKRSGEDSQSSSDHMLDEWLKGQGYERLSGWPDGAKFKKVTHPGDGGIMMPYIDGDDVNYRMVDDEGDHLVMCYEEGSITCDNTDGTVERAEEYDYTCEDCGAGIRCDHDDYIHAGRHEDRTVCEGCMDNYTRVEGQDSRGRTIEYYVRDHNASRLVNGDRCIDDDNPPSDVVQLENGGWADMDDCVCIDDEYYMCDDEDVVELANEWEDERYQLKDNCWQCAGSENWYHEDDTDDQVEIDGETYHRDHLSTLVNAKQVPLPLPEPVPEPTPVPEPLVPMEVGQIDRFTVYETCTAAAINTVREPVTLESIQRAAEIMDQNQVRELTGVWFDEATTISPERLRATLTQIRYRYY